MAAAGAGADPAGQFGFGTPFAEQLDFFRRKLNLPTEAYDDITRSAHDRAFMVAGAAKADVLQGLRNAVDKSMAAGESQGAFARRFRATVASTGWTGWTGEGSDAGVAWRAGIIYQTNMATSYAAGRYRQMTEPAFAAVRPYWKYVHAEGVLHPRPEHLAWNGLTLPIAHPFWQTHFAPNGWRCRCEIHPVKGPGTYSEPPTGWDSRNKVTGLLPGIDKGFDYAPGANAATPLREIIDQKLLNLDAPIGAAMWQTLKPVLAMERQAGWWQTLDEWLADPRPQGRTAVVGTLAPETVRWLADGGYPVPDSAEISISDRLVVGAKQARHIEQQNALTLAEWRALTKLLDTPGALYRQASNGNLVFVADGTGPAKAAVKYEAGSHQVATSFRISAEDVAAAVKGGLWQPIKG